jgi:YHS domain-containing protein
MRLLIFILLGYLLYRTLRRYLSPRQTLSRPEEGGAIDEMVQDPVCETYVPVREAEKRFIKGKTYYFCSKKCADAYEERLNE